MIVQYTAAAIVNDLASRAHPASVYSIPTSANAEDHVSMGANEARHVLDDDARTWRKVLALELYTAAQALDYRRDMINAARDLARRGDAEALAAKVQGAPAAARRNARVPATEVEALRARAGRRAANSSRAQRSVPRLVRLRARHRLHARDRAMDGDVAMAVFLVEQGELLSAARAAG